MPFVLGLPRMRWASICTPTPTRGCHHKASCPGHIQISEDHLNQCDDANPKTMGHQVTTSAILIQVMGFAHLRGLPQTANDSGPPPQLIDPHAGVFLSHLLHLKPPRCDHFNGCIFCRTYDTSGHTGHRQLMPSHPANFDLIQMAKPCTGFVIPTGGLT